MVGLPSTYGCASSVEALFLLTPSESSPRSPLFQVITCLLLYPKWRYYQLVLGVWVWDKLISNPDLWGNLAQPEHSSIVHY